MEKYKPTPLTSVLMVTYNHAPYIQQAIESVLTQETSFPFNLIVCDDASTDGTGEIVKKLAKNNENIFSAICKVCQKLWL